ncbi:DUF4192 domain-containing protein [Arthrobacter echini]|nr:DUF4192 domain-containing protein [Arthrobacter echini]
MNENQPFKVTTTADILAYVPRTLGFQPRESLAVITMRGKQLSLSLRVDLPAETATPADYAQGIMDYILADTAADGALIFVYTDEVADAAKTGTNHYAKPYMAHVQALETEMERAGWQVRGGWLITNLGWMPFFCEEEGCCILQQHEEIRDSALNAHMVVTGHTVDEDPARSLIDPAFIGSDTAHTTIENAAYWLNRLDPQDFTHPAMSEARAAWSSALGTTPTEAEACELVAYLKNPAIRDRILVDILSTTDDHGAFLQIIAGRYESTPDWSRVEAMQTLLAHLLPYTPTEDRAPLFTLLGWITWHQGSSSIATAYMEKALDISSQYRLARLMKELIRRGGVPLTAMNERTSYGAYWRNKH